MALVQALAGVEINSDSCVYTFTSNLGTHGSAGSGGANPSAGNDLIVVAFSLFGGNVTDCQNNQSDTRVLDYSDATNNFYVYRFAGISSSVTSITITNSASANTFIQVWEDDATLSYDALEAAWAASGEGFATDHDWAYGATAGDKIFICPASGGGQWNASSGTLALTPSASDIVGSIYKDVPGSGSGNVDLNFTSSSSSSAALLRYSRAAGTSIPIFMHHYLQNIGN